MVVSECPRDGFRCKKFGTMGREPENGHFSFLDTLQRPARCGRYSAGLAYAAYRQHQLLRGLAARHTARSTESTGNVHFSTGQRNGLGQAKGGHWASNQKPRPT